MLTLQHFVLRSEARKLYRDVLRSLRGVDPDTAAGVRAEARAQFAEHVAEHPGRSQGLRILRPEDAPLRLERHLVCCERGLRL